MISNLMKKFSFMFFFTVTILLSLFAVRDLFAPGYFESHDGVIHVMRFAHFYRAIWQGQFPLRWLSTWGLGYGSPVFNFNWSLPYYVGSIYHLVGFHLRTVLSLFL